MWHRDNRAGNYIQTKECAHLEKDDPLPLAYALSILLLSAQMWRACCLFDSLPDIAGEKDFLVPVLVVGDDVADISAIKGLSSVYTLDLSQ